MTIMMGSALSHLKREPSTPLLLLFICLQVACITNVVSASSSSSSLAPPLNYHLNGQKEETTSSTSKATTTPFVTIENILPPQLLEAFRNEILNYNTDPYECTLRRDARKMECGEERWLDITLEDVSPGGGGVPGVRDVMEQAIAEMAKYDLLEVLPNHMASQIVGVSWRVLTDASGQGQSLFHYDSDEGLDYVLAEVPLVHPVLSAVTYLTDYGEPTVFYEQAMIHSPLLLNETTKNNTEWMQPRAAYVSMPATNKHVAFDPRMFHGGGLAPHLSKHPSPWDGPDNWRIVIGTHYYTHHSVETTFNVETKTKRDGKLNPNNIVQPLTAEELACDEVNIIPWDPKDVISVEDRNKLPGYNNENWKSFPIPLANYGIDYCQHLAPCKIHVRLPVQQLLDDEYQQGTNHNNNGGNYGLELTPEDFVITSDPSSKAQRYTDRTMRRYRRESRERTKTRTQIVEFATQVFHDRCEMYEHDQLSMNPPTNYNFCDTIM